MGTRLVVALAVPLLGVGWLAAAQVSRVSADRARATRAEARADQVGALAALALSLREEQAMVTVLSGAAQLHVPPALLTIALGFDPHERFEAAATAVEATWGLVPGAPAADAATLAALRAEVRQGRLTGVDGLPAAYLTVAHELERVLADALVALRTATSAAGTGEQAAADVTTVSASVQALVAGLDQMGTMTALVESGLQARDVALPHALLDTNLLDDALDDVVAQGGPVADRAAALRSAPWFVTLQQRLDTIVTDAIDGRASSVAPADLRPLFDAFDQRGEALGGLVHAAVGVVRADAEAQVRADVGEVRRVMALAAGLLVVCAAASVAMARSTTRPLRAIERRTHQLVAGELDGSPLPTGGPREVAAAARAIDDLVTTLAVVTERADALAHGNLDAAGADRTVPGRLGASVQDAVSRLRATLAETNALRDELAHAATHDLLTGLPNRRAFLARLDEELRSPDGAPALVFVDLDGFKQANDTFGHPVGDAVLCGVADRLRALGPADPFSRFGGDEFVCLVPDGDAGRALGRRVVDALREPFVVDGAAVTVGASVGVALGGGPREDAAGLLARADAAVYAAKAAGRNCVVVADAVRATAPAAR